jgi:hypothetical protein
MTASLLCAALAASVLPDHLLNVVCRSGVVMDVDARCPGDDVATFDAGDISVWRDGACCALRTVDLDRVTAERPGQVMSLVQTGIVLPGSVSLPPPGARLALRAPSPPPWRPPNSLLLLKSSFLL